MGSFSAFSIAVLAVISTHNMIFPVKGQCTVEGCGTGDTSISIATEIRQMFAEFHDRLQAIDRRSQGQDICMKQAPSIQQLLNASIQHMKNQQDTAMTSLHAIDRRFEEQLQGMMNLNTSFQEMKNQQGTVMTSLQLIDRRSQEQLQVMTNLNTSLQQMKNQQGTAMTSLQLIDRRSQEQLQVMTNLNTSLQQMKNQQGTVMTSLQAVDQRSQEQLQGMTNLNTSLQQMKEQLQGMKNLNASLQQMNNKQDTVLRSLQAIDRRFEEQLQGMMNLNTSLQQMKNQQGTVMTSLQAVDRRSQEQLQVMTNLNTSFQQMKNQQDTVMTNLQAIDRRLDELDIAIKNETQKSWKLAIGVPLRQKTVTGLEGDVPLLPCFNPWTVIMNRFDGSLNFNKSWTDYKNGFGDKGRGEFWLGNEKIHRLTNRSGLVYALRVEVQLNRTGEWYSADYSAFSLDSENNKYTMRLSGFSGGNARDSLTDIFNLNGMNFSTFDSDNDGNPDNCASLFKAGWWYHSNCHLTCLTCTYDDFFIWYSLRQVASDGLGQLRAARMMIRSK